MAELLQIYLKISICLSFNSPFRHGFLNELSTCSWCVLSFTFTKAQNVQVGNLRKQVMDIEPFVGNNQMSLGDNFSSILVFSTMATSIDCQDKGCKNTEQLHQEHYPFLYELFVCALAVISCHVSHMQQEAMYSTHKY